MFILKIENNKNEVLQLTQNESKYQILSVGGLNPPTANIYTTDIAGYDGAKYKSSKLEMRNIVITVKINGNVEENRLHLYRYFRVKQWCRIYYRNESRDVYTEGYVETIECDNFTANEQAQISIVCPFPYWKSLEEIQYDISKHYSLFEFPFSFGAKYATETIPDNETDETIEFSRFDENILYKIVNTGESETGLIFRLVAKNEVVNPVIRNIDSGKFMKLNYTMQKDDIILISTIKGDKYIHLYQALNEFNILKYLTLESEWITLDIGINRLFYEADSGEDDLYIYTQMNTLYEGV